MTDEYINKEAELYAKKYGFYEFHDCAKEAYIAGAKRTEAVVEAAQEFLKFYDNNEEGYPTDKPHPAKVLRNALEALYGKAYTG